MAVGKTQNSDFDVHGQNPSYDVKEGAATSSSAIMATFPALVKPHNSLTGFRFIQEESIIATP
jgi:hypothetical protein